jgi:prepilin-type N-terminal cleavage/methylation domain-containing protein
MKKQKGTPSDHGFTVIELMVVLAVAVIVMGVALPNMMSWLPTYRLSAGARQLAGDLQLARMKAISQNTKYRLRFTTATSYEFEKESGGTFSTESGPFSLPDGITVTGTTPFTTSEFQARGTVNAGGVITLKNINNLEKTVQVNIVGRVAIL